MDPLGRRSSGYTLGNANDLESVLAHSSIRAAFPSESLSCIITHNWAARESKEYYNEAPGNHVPSSFTVITSATTSPSHTRAFACACAQSTFPPYTSPLSTQTLSTQLQPPHPSSPPPITNPTAPLSTLTRTRPQIESQICAPSTPSATNAATRKSRTAVQLL
jgi:hypothetical protein